MRTTPTTPSTDTGFGAHLYPTRGTLAWSVCEFFRTNPDEKLNDGDIALKFDAAPREIAALLDGAVKHGWLARSPTPQRQHIYSAGRSLVALASVAPAAASKPEARATKAPRGGPRKRLPALDIKALKVEDDMPMPIRGLALKGRTAYDGLFELLDRPGTSTDVPGEYRATLAKARDKWVKRHPEQRFQLAQLDDGRCRIKRLA